MNAVYDPATDRIWASQAPTIPGTHRSHVVLYAVDVIAGGTSTVTFADPSMWQWNPSVMLIDDGNVAVTFSRSSRDDYPSMWAVQKTAGAWQAPRLLKQSLASYQLGRWGDYAGSSVDPDPGIRAIWLYNEYVVSAPERWGTWLARVGF